MYRIHVTLNEYKTVSNLNNCSIFCIFCCIWYNIHLFASGWASNNLQKSYITNKTTLCFNALIYPIKMGVSA